MSLLLGGLANYLLPIVFSAASAVLVRLFQKLGSDKHVSDNEVLASALRVVDNFVQTTVRDLEQTMVARLKAETADGQLDQAGAEAVKAEALRNLRAMLGEAGIQRLARAMQADDNAVTKLLGAKVEATVQALKGQTFDPLAFGGMTAGERAAAATRAPAPASAPASPATGGAK